MTRWVLAAAAAEELERLVEFLLGRFPEDAVKLGHGTLKNAESALEPIKFQIIRN